MGAFKPTPVSRQLDAQLRLYPDQKRVDGQGKVSGPLRRFVPVVMRPSPYYRIITAARGKDVDWREQLYAFISNGAMWAQLACDGYSVISSVVLGRSEFMDR